MGTPTSKGTYPSIRHTFHETLGILDHLASLSKDFGYSLAWSAEPNIHSPFPQYTIRVEKLDDSKSPYLPNIEAIYDGNHSVVGFKAYTGCWGPLELPELKKVIKAYTDAQTLIVNLHYHLFGNTGER